MQPIRSAIVCCVVVAASTPETAATSPLNTLTEAQWRADLEQLVALIRNVHVRPHWLTPAGEFDITVREATAAVAAAGSIHERVAAMMRVIAAIRDGHSVLAGPDRYRVFGYLPVSVEGFADGLYVVRTTRANAHLLGARLESIDGVAIDRVLERLRPYIPAATENRFRRWLPAYLHLPGLLQAVGVSRSPAEALFEFSSDGGTKRAVFTDMPPEQEQQAEFVSLLDQLSSTSLRFRDRSKAYWLKHLPEHNAVYFKYNRVRSDEDENAWTFADRLLSLVKDKQVSRLVIDLRDNGGGGYQFGAQFWEGVKQLRRVNRRGRLFVLTGKKTFSAAMNVALKFRMHTDAIFVGEEPGDLLASPGDDDDETLAHSGLTVRLSRQFHEVPVFGDAAEHLRPDHVIPETFADLDAGRDPALAFALSAVIPDTPATLKRPARFAGRYAVTPDVTLVIEQREQQLVARAIPDLELRLDPSGPGRFATTWPALTFEFQTTGDLIARLGSSGIFFETLEASAG